MVEWSINLSSTPTRMPILNIACKFMTIAAMLAHSFFGCSLHHAGACGSHDHGDHFSVESHPGAGCCDELGSCGESGHDDHVSQDRKACSDEDAPRDGSQIGLVVTIASDCGCCEHSPCDHDESPCCSPVQCSFMVSGDFELMVDVSALFYGIVDGGFSATEPLIARRGHALTNLRSGLDGPLSRCALHCSWQI
jgi:hypothetical protein